MDIDKYLNNYIVVGVSAGPDSMCLLDILRKKTDKIIVCHVNHNVRKESKIEEEYIKNYCKENNLILEYMKIKEYNENNFEAEARKKRYNFYEAILKKYNTKYLFLAHHGDDLIETVLMKIIRGSNIKGYSGIKLKTNYKDFTIIRPLIKYTKEDIIKYNKENNIKYFIDKTNSDINYTRNRIRKNILPLLKEEDKSVHLKFLKYSNILTEYDDYVNKVVDEKIKNLYKNDKIDLVKLKEEDLFIVKNIIYKILLNLYQNDFDLVKEKHIKNIINIFYNDKPNVYINLPKNIILTKEYNEAYFIKKNNYPNNYNIEMKHNLYISDYAFRYLPNIDSDGNDICRLNSKEINLPLRIRNRKDGDYIILKGNNNKKKIKDIFIEKKIPLNKRNNYPLLVDKNDNILWIPNIKKSKYCIKKDEINKNYDIIIRCSEREE